MEEKTFPYGSVVKNKKSGRIGLVVPDVFRLCKEHQVSVEWEGATGTQAVNIDGLEFVERIQPELDRGKCRDCIFFNGAFCFRCTPGRLGMMSSGKSGVRIPDRVYCQSSRSLSNLKGGQKPPFFFKN